MECNLEFRKLMMNQPLPRFIRGMTSFARKKQQKIHSNFIHFCCTPLTLFDLSKACCISQLFLHLQYKAAKYQIFWVWPSALLLNIYPCALSNQYWVYQQWFPTKYLILDLTSTNYNGIWCNTKDFSVVHLINPRLFYLTDISTVDRKYNYFSCGI